MNVCKAFLRLEAWGVNYGIVMELEIQNPTNKRKRAWLGKNGKSLASVAGLSFNESLSFFISHEEAKKVLGKNEICKI